MAITRSFKIGQYLGRSVSSGAIGSDGSAGGGGTTTYTAIGDLPSSGSEAGELAFVDSSDKLYIWTGEGWYNIAVINRTPTIQSILDSDNNPGPFTLSTFGATTTITVLAQDSDGFPVTYSALADSSFNGIASINQSSNVFTITPFSEDSATGASGTITFKASDGVNLASTISTFTLTFVTGFLDFSAVPANTTIANYAYLEPFPGGGGGTPSWVFDGDYLEMIQGGSYDVGFYRSFSCTSGTTYTITLSIHSLVVDVARSQMYVYSDVPASGTRSVLGGEISSNGDAVRTWTANYTGTAYMLWRTAAANNTIGTYKLNSLEISPWE